MPAARLLTPFLPAALACSALAQGSIADANVRYAVGAISAIQAESVNCDFTADPAVPDGLFEHWWYYRLQGDPDESPFRSDGSLQQGYVGSHADLDWADVGGRGTLRAELDIDVVSTGPTSGVVISRMTVVNTGPSSVRLDLFHYADLDVCGVASNTVTGTVDRHLVGGGCGASIEFHAAHPELWDVGSFRGDELGLADGTSGNLAGNSPPFGPGDYTGAFQWQDHLLLPGQSSVFTSVLAHGTPACAAALVHYGIGTTGGGPVPGISSSSPPLQPGATSIDLTNAPPGALGVLLSSFTRADVNMFGLRVFVNPARLWTQIAMVNGSGRASVLLSIPPVPELCGAPLHHQWGVIHPGGVGGLADTTRGMSWEIGLY